MARDARTGDMRDVHGGVSRHPLSPMAHTTGPVPYDRFVRYRLSPPPRGGAGRSRTPHRRSLAAVMAVAIAMSTSSCATSPDAAATTEEQRPETSELVDDSPDQSAEPPNNSLTNGTDSPTAPAADVDAEPSQSPVPPPATPTTTVVAPKTVLPVNPSVPTTVALPQPIAPPLDDEASEPVIVLGSLTIPTIGLDATLYEGIRLPTFDKGPAHWPGSAMPGQIGNMVIGGHRTSGNADFRHLDQLKPGDEMIVTDTDGGRHTYVVDYSEITDPFAAGLIYQTPAHTATLFACHPPGSITRRIVVHLTLLQ